jgi:zinc protease
MGYPQTGTLETTANITLTDLKTYYNTNISPAAAAFHVVGAFQQPKVQAALSTLASGWAAKEVKRPTYPIPAQSLGGNVYFIDVPNAKQSVLYIGKLALSGKDPQSSPLNFANVVLGGGSSGRLFQTLRIQKGYTYGAHSFVQKLNEVAPFIIYTNVRANATLPSLQLVRRMLQEYGPTYSEADVQIAKNKVLKGNTLAYESLNDKLGLLRDISKYGKSLKFVEEDQQALLRMNLTDFKTTIAKHLAEKDLVYVVVGDKATQYNEVKTFANDQVILLDIHGNPVK